MPRKTDDFDLELAVQAYYDNAGNKAEAARSVGLKRQTYNDRLNQAQKRFGLTLGKVADGSIQAKGASRLKLPKKGQVARYILTSVQNNTHIHPGWNNLTALSEELDSIHGGSCRIMVGTFSYQLAAYGKKAVKRGTYNRMKANEDLWYATEALPHILDDDVELAPGLVWCGRQNILPTNKHPLNGLEEFYERKSVIVPHVKNDMKSVPSMPDEATKFMYATGTMSQRNYIQKRLGIIAEQSHVYGGALVEVDDRGNWYVRQLMIGDDDSICEVGPDGGRGIYVQAGQVHLDYPVVKSIYFGDPHAAEMELWVRRLAWGHGGMLDQLRPETQFMGDIFSMRSRSHHELKDPLRQYQKHVDGEDTVEEEIALTTDFVNEADRPYCETIIVHGNHDRHLDRWLSETDWRDDPVNARTYLQLNDRRLRAVEEGDRDFNVLEYAMKRAGCGEAVRFLGRDESYKVLGIENGLHGDEGPNGSRGSTTNLRKLGRKVNKGHDHQAAISGPVYSAGACSLEFPYMHGPGSHSISHIVTYINGTRALITMWGGKWRL